MFEPLTDFIQNDFHKFIKSTKSVAVSSSPVKRRNAEMQMLDGFYETSNNHI